MEKKPKIKRLRALMKAHSLSAADVGKILNREAKTIQAWLSVGQTRPIPDSELLLLKLELERRKGRP